MSSGDENTNVTGGPRPLCPGCMGENEPGVPFCHHCGMPIGKIATIDPMQSIYATGWMYRRAISGCSKPIVLLGMLLIFLPSAFLILVSLTLLGWARGLRGLQSTDIATFAISLAVTCLYFVIVVRVIKGYLKKRLRAQGRCVRCGYNLAHLTVPRCPECGTEFDFEDVAMPADETALSDETSAAHAMTDPGQRAMPITCAMCDSVLPAKIELGICPNCGAKFNRRERVFDIHGPEAFLEEPQIATPKRISSWAPYYRALAFSAVAMVSLPVARYLVHIGVIDANRTPFVLFFFVIAFFEWFRAGREGTHEAADEATEDDPPAHE